MQLYILVLSKNFYYFFLSNNKHRIEYLWNFNHVIKLNRYLLAAINIRN